MTHPAWLLLSATAMALPPGPASPADQSIIVTGARPTHDAVARYVDSITVEADGQLATFRQPICPAAFGLPPSFNRVIEQRIRDDAMLVGLRVADDHCDANVVLIVADEPLPLIKVLQRKRPQMFAGIEYDQVQRLLKTKEPVRVWQAIEPRGSDGRPLERVMFVGARPVGGNGAWFNPAASNSRIEQNIRPDLVASFVIIAADATDGLTLTQIADYAAMRALAKTRPAADGGGPTILGLFDQTSGGGRASKLTSWDVGYLRSLYQTDNRLAAHSQESAIAGAIRRGLKEAAER